MKKSLKVLSLVLVAMFTLSCIPASAGFNGNEAAPGLYLDFETAADLNTANAGVNNYYKLEDGALKIDGTAITNTGDYPHGFDTAVPLKTGDITYNLSFKYMAKEGTTLPTYFGLVLRTMNSDGTLANGTEFTDTTKQIYPEISNIVADGNWRNYSFNFNFNNFGGMVITDMTAFRVGFRMAPPGEDSDSVMYVDDIVVEPVGIESYPKAPTAYTTGEELLGESRRKMIDKYNSGIENKGTFNLVKAADGSISSVTDGRGIVKTAGKTGDPAYIMAASTASGVTYQSSGYDVSGVEGNKVYQFTARLKAPAVTVDETLSTDNVFYIDETTGEVSGKSAAVVNNYIGGTLTFSVIFKNVTANGAFTGYLDADGNYVPLTYNVEAANNGKPTLTTEWIDYVGYFMVPATEEIVVNTANGINIYVKGVSGQGIMYVDEMSVKPYTSTNLIPNGDFGLTAVSNYNTTTIANCPLFFRESTVNVSTTTNYQIMKENNDVFVFQSFANPKTLPLPVQVEAGKSYKLTVVAKARNQETGNLDITLTKGENTLAVTTESAPAEVTNKYATYNYIISPTTELAVEGDVAPVLNIKYLPDEPEGNKGIYYNSIQLVELPAAYVEDIAVTGDLTEGKTVTATWKKFPADSTATQVVKVSAGNDESGYALIDTSSTVTESKEVVLPVGTKGKNVKIEVITYVDGEPLNVSAYVTDAIAEAPEVIEGVEITDAAKNEMTFDANVSYVGEDDAFILFATYDANGKMVNLLTFDLAKDGTVTPVSITNAGAASAKVMVFDGRNLTETNVIPMCDFVEIR